MNARDLSIAATFTAAALLGSPFAPVTAQSSGTGSLQLIWENDRIRVDRISLAPGERLTAASRGGSVIVFLTADLEGRMPAAEALWRDPGAVTMENRGRASFEALIIDLKSSVRRAPGISPPETVHGGRIAQRPAYGDTVSGLDARNLIDNEYISVTKQRYGPGSYAHFEPLHFHPQDAVVIFLRGGAAWPAAGSLGPDVVRRGDVRVVPANTIHRAGNAGSDPLELLLIIPG